MKSPIISIDRASKRFAIFDDFNCVRGFEDYTDEKTIIQFAKDYIKIRTDIAPEIVYPSIKSIRMS